VKKFVCSICGYVYEGENPPEKCPQCGAPAEKFFEQKEGEPGWADEHVIGVAKDVDTEVIEGLRANFTGECTEVGMYLAMSRQADREGYPEVAQAFRAIAKVEEEHEKRYRKLIENIEKDQVFKKETEVKWVCRNCGYVHYGKEAPEKCPSCLHPKEYFEVKSENY